MASEMDHAVRAAIGALETIERWFGQFPETSETWPGTDSPVSYGALFGSNGERDFMRGDARKALFKIRAALTPPAADAGGDAVRVPGIYIASKTAHAARWRNLRATGIPIISTWIDEAGQGETSCFANLWRRCVDEARSAQAVVVYREPGEVLKGAFVETGAALASGVPVFAVGCDEFSFVNHSGVTRCATLDHAISLAAHPRPVESEEDAPDANWIKPLVWRDEKGNTSFNPYYSIWARTPLGIYCVNNMRGHHLGYKPTKSTMNEDYRDEKGGKLYFDTPDECREFLEREYKKDALELFAKPPSPRPTSPVESERTGWRDFATVPDGHFPVHVWALAYGQCVAFRDATGAWWPVPAIKPLRSLLTHWRPLPAPPANPADLSSGDGEEG